MAGDCILQFVGPCHPERLSTGRRRSFAILDAPGTAGNSRCLQTTLVTAHWASLIGVAFGLVCNVAFAAGKPNKSGEARNSPTVCIMNSGRAAADDSDDESGGVRWVIGGTCVNVSADAQATGQVADVSQPRAVLGLSARRTLTGNAGFRLETARDTQFGGFKTAFAADWSYYSDTGFDNVPNLGEASVSYLGLTVGFTDSLMNFWDGDFQFKAAGPSLSSFLANKAFSLSNTATLAFGVEAGPPDSRGAEAWKFPSTPPYFTSRLRYETDDWTLHASVAARKATVSETPLQSGTGQQKPGWAASLGAQIPLKLLDAEDAASVQFTYAVNSRVFLGAATDRAALASIIPKAVAVPTTGWSAIGSLHHNWNRTWASNFFAGRVAVDADAGTASPTFRSRRVGANLICQLTEHWLIGAEVSHVKARIAPNGTLGILNGASFAGRTGAVWLKWEL